MFLAPGGAARTPFLQLLSPLILEERGHIRTRQARFIKFAYTCLKPVIEDIFFFVSHMSG